MKTIKYIYMALFMLILIVTCIKAVYNDGNEINVYAKSENDDLVDMIECDSNLFFSTRSQDSQTEGTSAESAIIDNTSYEVEESENNDPNYGYSEYDIYLLARITMAEAEDEPMLCKEYTVQTVLNRVDSDEFPDTIYDVIFEKNQFTPISDGRWDRVEPNDDCYDAVYYVISQEYPIIDSLYFECCDGDSWHSRNLTLIDQSGSTRFYK